jgi:hypothetical protein
MTRATALDFADKRIRFNRLVPHSLETLIKWESYLPADLP